MTLAAVLIALHALFAAVWVGGLVFAYTVLRPSVDVMADQDRLPLLARIFRRWFIWIWHAAVIMPVTGLVALIVLYGGFAGAGVYIHIMHLLGWIMVAAFLALFFGPYPGFKRATADGEWTVARSKLTAMRRIILFNLVVAILTVAVGAGGRYV